MSKEEENKDSESAALEPSARAIRLAQTHVLAKVRWRYRPEGFVLAKKGVQVHDILVVTSDFLDTDAVEVIAIRPLTPEQADRPGFEEAVNHQAHCASEDEIRKVIESLPDKSIKSIMVAFKKDYNGKADMALVNKIAREYQGK